MESINEQIIFLNSDLPYLFQRVFIAALLGIFIGIERESKKVKSEKFFGGIRTVPLITILGFIAALVGFLTNQIVYVSIFAAFGLLISISYYFSAQRGEFGGTTEITFIIMFLIGSLVYWDLLMFSAAITVILGIFLAFKAEFRALVGKISDEDIYATIKFAILTIIILPMLPDKNYGPFNSLNPQRIWLMVILIAAVSFIGYALFKIIGTKKGIQILSILGGIASSTALTLSFVQRSKEAENLSKNFAAGIVLASSIMFPRVLLILFLVNARLASALTFPFIIFSIVGIITSYFLWEKNYKEKIGEIVLTNPFKVAAALKFGIVFAIVLLISNGANEYFGNQGIFFSSFISGFADVDAVALTISDLAKKSISLDIASAAIFLACLSNSIIKMSIALIFGSTVLKKFMAIGFAPIMASLLIYASILLWL